MSLSYDFCFALFSCLQAKNENYKCCNIVDLKDELLIKQVRFLLSSGFHPALGHTHIFDDQLQKTSTTGVTFKSFFQMMKQREEDRNKVQSINL
jgi:ribulose bisphosphate carboxylase small subunit